MAKIQIKTEIAAAFGNIFYVLNDLSVLASENSLIPALEREMQIENHFNTAR